MQTYTDWNGRMPQYHWSQFVGR